MLIPGATASSYIIPPRTPVGVGYYYCEVTATRNDTGMSKSVTSDNAAVTVTKKPVSLTWNDGSFIYDGTEKTITAIVNNALPGDRVTVTSYENTENRKNSAILAGTYTAAAAAVDNQNYTVAGGTEITKSWTIGKKVPKLTPIITSLTFPKQNDPSVISFQYEYDGDGDVTSSFVFRKTSDSTTGSEAEPQIVVDSKTKTVMVTAGGKNGKIEITLTAAETQNYTTIANSTIALAQQNGKFIGGADNYIGVYDGKYHGIDARPLLSSVAVVAMYKTDEALPNDPANFTQTTSPVFKDVGEYSVTYAVVMNGTTILSIDTTKVKITPAPLMARYEGETITFGATPVLDIKVVGFVEGESAAMLGEKGYIAPSFGKTTIPSNPGVYQLTPVCVKLPSKLNYVFVDKDGKTGNPISGIPGNLIINPAVMTGVDANSYNGVYDGKEHGIEVGHPSDNAQVYYGTSADNCTETDSPTYTDAGKYMVYYRVVMDGYHDVLGSAVVEISKAPLTAVYRGGIAPYLADPNAGSFAEVDVTGFVPEETPEELQSKGKYTPPTVADIEGFPGVYVRLPQGGSAENYTFTYVEGILTIGTIGMEQDIKSEGYTGVYNGESHTIKMTVADSGSGEAHESARIWYGLSADNCQLTAPPTFKNAGSYTVFYRVSQVGYDNVSGSDKVLITQRSVSVTSAQVSDKVYDGKTDAQGTTLTLNQATYNGNVLSNKEGVIQKTIGGASTWEDVTVSGTAAFTTKDAGTAKHVNINGILFSGADKDNYNLLSTVVNDMETNAVIAQKQIDIKWNNYEDLVYTGQPANVNATAGGLVTSGSSAIADTCGITVVDGNKIMAGNHTATANAVTNPNYKLPADISNQNYTIEKASLQAVPDDIAIPYGTVSHTFSVTLTGFVNGETETSDNNLVKPTVKVYNGNEVATDISTLAAGKYILKAEGGQAGNYSFTYPNGELTINPAGTPPVSVPNHTGDYDGIAHGLEITLPAGWTLEISDQQPLTERIAAISYTDADGSKLNDHPTRIDAGTTEVNYIIKTKNFNDFTGNAVIKINPKRVSATISPINPLVTREYNGDSDASTTTELVVSGTAGVETLAISGKLTFDDKNAGKGKSVTATEITLGNGAGGGKASNYTVAESVSAMLPTVAIVPRPVSLNWSDVSNLVYTGKEQNLTAAAVGVIGGESCDVIVSGGNQVNVNAVNRPYSAVATLDNSNYTIMGSNTKEYDIEKAVLTATYHGETIVYGTKPLFNITVNGFMPGEGPSMATNYAAPSIQQADADGLPVIEGGYLLTAEGGTADNYSFNYVAGTLLITGKPMDSEVFSSGYKGVYDGEPHSILVNVPADAAVTYYSDPEYRNEITDEDLRSRTNVTDGDTIYYKVAKINHKDYLSGEDIVITPKPLMPVVNYLDAVWGKTYDGKTDAEGFFELNGLLAKDSVMIEVEITHPDDPNTPEEDDPMTEIVERPLVDAVGVFEFTTPNAGTSKSVNVSNIKLVANGSDQLLKDNYKLVLTELKNVQTNAIITPIEVEISWKGFKNLVYDGTVKNVRPVLSNVLAGDNCKTTVVKGAETYPGRYTAKIIGLSNPNYALPPDRLERKYTIEKAQIEDVAVSPYIGIYDGKYHDSLTVSGLHTDEPKDTVSYQINGGTWRSAIPQVGIAGDMHVMVRVARLYHDDYYEPVTSVITRGPKVSIATPLFDETDVHIVTVGGIVEVPDEKSDIASQTFDYRKTGGASKWVQMMPDQPFAEFKSPSTYEVRLDDLEEGVEYELRLSATDKNGVIAEAKRKFRTQLIVPPTGSIEGTVIDPLGHKISILIEHGNTAIASIKDLDSGQHFKFTRLPDGEYNLVATNGVYVVTKMVTVEDGMAVSGIVMKITNQQSSVLIEDDAPPVAVDGLMGLFDSSIATGNLPAQTALQNGTVEMRLTANPAIPGELALIEAQKPSSAIIGESVDLRLDMIIMPENDLTTVKPISDTDGVPITIAVPLPNSAQGKGEYKAYRYHGGSVEELSASQTLGGDWFRVKGRFAYIHAAKFSTYAIYYLPSKDEPKPDDSSGNQNQENSSNNNNNNNNNNSSSTPSPSQQIAAVPASTTASVPLSEDATEKPEEEIAENYEDEYGENIQDFPPQVKTVPASTSTTDSASLNEDMPEQQKEEVTPNNDELSKKDDRTHANKPFVLLSALLTAAAIAFAIAGLSKKSRKKQKWVSVLCAIAAAAVFLVTSGFNGFIFISIWSWVIAVCLVPVVVIFLRSPKEKT